MPLTFCTDTPAARPSSERDTSPTPLSRLSSALIFVVAPVKSRLSCVPIPVTTTSWSWLVSGDISMRIGSAVAFFSTGAMPTNEKWSVTPALGTLIENLPSMSVAVAWVVFPFLPFTCTVTPGNGSSIPFSMTTPVTVISAAKPNHIIRNVMKNRSFLFIQ